MKSVGFLIISILIFTSCEREPDPVPIPPDPYALRYVDIADALTVDIDDDGNLDVQIYNAPETTYTGWGDTIPYTALRIKSLNDSLRLSLYGFSYELYFDQTVDGSLYWFTNYRLESYIPLQPAHDNAPYVGLELRKDGEILYGWISKPLSNNLITEFAIEVEENGIGKVKTGKRMKE